MPEDIQRSCSGGRNKPPLLASSNLFPQTGQSDFSEAKKKEKESILCHVTPIPKMHQRLPLLSGQNTKSLTWLKSLSDPAPCTMLLLPSCMTSDHPASPKSRRIKFHENGPTRLVQPARCVVRYPACLHHQGSWQAHRTSVGQSSQGRTVQGLGATLQSEVPQPSKHQKCPITSSCVWGPPEWTKGTAVRDRDPHCPL